MNQDQNHCSEQKPSPCDKPQAVPLEPVVGLWIDASVELPETKRRVLVFTEHYAKTGSFSPFQFGRYTEAGVWIIDGEKRPVAVTHWARPIKPNPTGQGRADCGAYPGWRCSPS